MNPSIYEGNSQLCGKIIMRSCPGDGDDSVPSNEKEAVSDADFELLWIYAAFAPGFLGVIVMEMRLLQSKSRSVHQMRPSRIIKCVTVGDGAVGNLLRTYSSSTSPVDYELTVSDNFSANVAVKGAAVVIHLGFWETSDHEDDYMDGIRPLSYRGAQVFILAFSLVSKSSYEDVSNKWVPELNQYSPGVPIILVGTKAGNPGAVPISTAQGEELGREIGAAAYIECGSKSEDGVKQVFDAAIKVVLYKKSRGKSGQKACCFIL